MDNQDRKKPASGQRQHLNNYGVCLLHQMFENDALIAMSSA
jgi:hypothetical protein